MSVTISQGDACMSQGSQGDACLSQGSQGENDSQGSQGDRYSGLQLLWYTLRSGCFIL